MYSACPQKCQKQKAKPANQADSAGCYSLLYLGYLANVGVIVSHWMIIEHVSKISWEFRGFHLFVEREKGVPARGTNMTQALHVARAAWDDDGDLRLNPTKVMERLTR